MVPSMMNRRAFLGRTGATGIGIALGVDLLACQRGSRSAAGRGDVADLTERAIGDFVSAIHGTVLRPTDAGYDEARRVWNARFDRHPALIARCVDAADVQRSVQFARAQRLAIAVRGGGHSFAGHSTCDGGVVIDLSTMKGIRVDSDRHLITVQPGVVSRELAVASQSAGLAPILGGCSDVGIGGFTLGGGEGSLSPMFGLACDNLVSADVVLADGRRVTASAIDNADLFWGLRGGGGNYGIVTSFRIRAHPVTRVVSGALMYELSRAASVMRAYRDFASSAPDALDAGFSFGRDAGGPRLALRIDYAGTPEAADSVLRTLRGSVRPRTDTIAPVAYHDLKREPGPPAGFASITTGAFLPDLSDDTIDALVALAAGIPPGADVELNHLHGAITRVPLTESAFPLRQAGFDTFVAAAWLKPEQQAAVVEWVDRVAGVLRQHATGAYVNVLNEHDANRVADVYGAQYARLAALKKKYDPGNTFRLNANVVPAS
jgi:FAD/FMN-containing dehydrogenase